MEPIIDQETLQNILERVGEIVSLYGFKLIGALAVLLAGLFVIKRINIGLQRLFNTTELDPALETFLQSIITAGLKILLVIIVISMLGVETTSLVALLGAAGLAIGLSLQGSLANFAGGALILFFKPFTVGDRIETQNHVGTVERIQILYTILRNANNEHIVIPNGELSNNSLVNTFANEHTGLEIDFGVGYGDDIDTAKNIIRNIIDGDKRILSDPAPLVVVSELADSFVNIKTRVFVIEPKDYWDLNSELKERVKKEFDKAGISIPFPQRDVHVYNHN